MRFWTLETLPNTELSFSLTLSELQGTYEPHNTLERRGEVLKWRWDSGHNLAKPNWGCEGSLVKGPSVILRLSSQFYKTFEGSITMIAESIWLHIQQQTLWHRMILIGFCRFRWPQNCPKPRHILSLQNWIQSWHNPLRQWHLRQCNSQLQNADLLKVRKGKGAQKSLDACSPPLICKSLQERLHQSWHSVHAKPIFSKTTKSHTITEPLQCPSALNHFNLNLTWREGVLGLGKKQLVDVRDIDDVVAMAMAPIRNSPSPSPAKFVFSFWWWWK